MSRSILRLIVAVACAALLLPSLGYAQSQNSQSVADAARRAREAKEKAAQAPQKSKVITDDDIKPSNAKPATDSVASASAPAPTADSNAAAPPPPVDAAAPADTTAAGAPGANSETQPNANDSSEVAEAKRAVAEAQKELDFLKRALGLDQDTFFSNPDHDRDAAGKAKLAGEQQQIDLKQADVDELKSKLTKLLAAGQSPEQPKTPQP